MCDLSKNMEEKKAVNHSTKLTNGDYGLIEAKWCGQDNFDANDLRCPN